MNRNSICQFIQTRLVFSFLLFIVFVPLVNAQNITITIHLRGVNESKISVLPLSGPNALKPITIVDGIKNGEDSKIIIQNENLPGEFVLRFDYKEKGTSTPYPSEKQIIVGNQDLELWVNPVYCNNPDSTWFQKDERENSAYFKFLSENARQMNMLGLLQNFLLNYDNTGSSFYKEAITEYELRRKDFNLWVATQIRLNKDLFASGLFRFHYIPNIRWEGNESDRKQSLRDNYFEGMDLSYTIILKTSKMKEWMDGYVNLYGELATSITIRDSLFTLAGKNAIEMAKKGNPLVYGWMVDYFFNGYESNNIEKGIKMLEPYLNDPNCLTSKQQSIIKRLKGMETLIPGVSAPDISMLSAEDKLFELSGYKPETDYILILFWSADCTHCNEMAGELYTWFKTSEIQTKLAIVAISVDETGTEIQAWKRKIEGLSGWMHLRAEEGVRSKVANDYFILSVPVMILLNTKTKEIISLPVNIEQLEEYIF